VSGPICFLLNHLRIQLWHLVVAPGCRKVAEMAVFEGFFQASVHRCTQPRLVSRHERFVADSCVRERWRQPTFHVRAPIPFSHYGESAR
jgi:hypothetical protein